MRPAHLVASVLSVLLLASDGGAQERRPSVPVIVAEALTFMPWPTAKPQFYDGRLPEGWPAALVPPEASVVGGGVIGDPGMFRMRVAVFEVPAGSDRVESLRDLLVREGFTQIDAAGREGGGFVATTPESTGPAYCRGSVVAGVGIVDSTGTARAVAFHLIDGEVGRGMCAPRPRPESRGPHTRPIDVPALAPPSGSVSRQSGSSWTGGSGELRAVLQSTTPVDSIIAHYSAQLAAAGWTPDGEPAATSTVGAQRFAFRSGEEGWTGSLFVIAVRDRRELILQLARDDIEDDF